MQRTPRALTTLALVLAVGLAGCADEEPRADDPGPGDTTSSTASQPTEDATTSDPSPTATATTGKVTVPVYFVARTPVGTRLFREFRQVESDNPLAEAVALMTAGDALDADYSTLFPGGAFEDAGFSEAGQVLVARVADDSWAKRPAGMSPREARLAVQQLVYTMQGVQGQRLPVIIQDAKGPTSLFGIDSAEGLTAAKQLDVLGLVNVTAPEEGSTVAGTFMASGVASSFEATVLWQIRDEGGATVAQGFATAEGWINKLFPWETEVDVSGLEPGTYSFVAMTDDPSGGEGPGPTEDSKTIIIE